MVDSKAEVFLLALSFYKYAIMVLVAKGFPPL